MGLQERLLGQEDPSISGLQFTSALIVVLAGQATLENVRVGFGIEVDDARWLAFVSAWNTAPDQRKLIDAVHALSQLSRHPQFNAFFDQAKINAVFAWGAS